MPAPITLAQHLATAQAQAAARGLSAEVTSRVLEDAVDYWQSRLNTPSGKPGG